MELCLRLVAAVLNGFGIAVERLAEKPKDGEARFSGIRLVAAFAPLVVLLLVIGGTWAFVDWRANVREARERETRKLVEHHVGLLASDVDEDGRVQRPAMSTLDVNDAWGVHSVLSSRKNWFMTWSPYDPTGPMVFGILTTT